MDNTNSLYELTKQFAALQYEHAKQKQYVRMKSKVKLQHITREGFQIFDNIPPLSTTYRENAVDIKVAEDPPLRVDCKTGLCLYNIKENIGKLYVKEETKSNEIKLSHNLEQYVEELYNETQEQKQQVKMFASLRNNFNVILESNSKDQIMN